MTGRRAPAPLPTLPGPRASSEAVERIAELTHGGMDFYLAFREVMAELDPPVGERT